jgi:multimeric flavodoxin WrbA
MSAQAKLFTDRLYAFYMTGFEEKYGKKDMALVFSQGNPEDLFTQYFDYTQDMFNFLGFNVVDLLHSKENGAPGDVRSKENIMENAREIGKMLVQN